ncbi:hypothetical protein MLD38_040066 [Melastoma candidum]|uniref:Uncharacterized protein n=1 Tax=Melastoma candidum TaxID=119954 RepID=A0ACB9L478_9MYRT|nr:hypothetical protein MLD38_040066 [Melastoma candidum]
MEDLRLIERTVLFPKTKNTKPRRLFLSNIDLSLLGHHEHVCFFHTPPNGMTFQRVREILHDSLETLLVPYDFLAGRLVPSADDVGRLEIECDGSGIVVVVARTDCRLSELGELCELKPEFKRLTAFLHDEGEELKDLGDLPLLRFQVM